MSEPQQRGERSSGTASAVLSVELIPGLSRDNAATQTPFQALQVLGPPVRNLLDHTASQKKWGGKHKEKPKKVLHHAIAVVYCGERALLAASAASGARRARLYWLCKQTASTASTRPFVRPPQ